MVNGLFKRSEEILEEAKRRDLTSEELLALKSRTYYPAIKLLGLCKGEKEENKESYVRTAYNIFRAIDECEDVPIRRTDKTEREIINTRMQMLNRISYIVGEIAKKSYQNGKGLTAIIESDNLKTVTKWLTANEPDIEGKVFAEHFGRGVVLRDFYEIGKEGEVGDKIKTALDYSVKSMADGMINFLDKGPIEEIPQLITYCDYVAGDVGKKFLNELVRLKDKDKDGKPIELSADNATQLARYLQLTNIIKNIRCDYDERRRFLPGKLLYGDVSYNFMMDGDSNAARGARHSVFDTMVNKITGKKLFPSLDYIRSIPDEISGYKAFCLFPVLLAEKTLETIRTAGPERVFKGEKEGIKITYGVDKFLEFVHGITTYEEGANLNRWTEEFQAEPKSFSFKPEEYEKWVGDWIKK